jgi:hypothetical protein
MQMEQDEKLRQLARSLPVREPDELPLRRLKARLLRDAALGAPASRHSGRQVAVAVVALGMGLSAWLIVATRTSSRVASSARTTAVTTTPSIETPVMPKSEELAGSVVPSPSARWSQTREQAIERVTIDDGAIRVHVRHQASGERFLVVLPDGEIEVRGTTFDVSVERGATAHVYVDEGVVELRIRDRPVVRLAANEAWSAPLPSRSASQKPSPPLHAAVPAPSVAVPPTTHEVSHGGDYASAIELLRKGQYDQAASAFHALAQADPATQADDSSFLEAIALARAGRTDAAALVAERHLASFPDSFHRKEASILVARAASQRGDCAKARTTMAPWMKASFESGVRTALGSCEASSR